MKRAGLCFALVLVAAHAVAAEPKRIVSTSPSITDTLFALDLGDRVVGVSRYCRHPPAVDALPRVGTFLKPDVEAIARLRPDLVVVHKSADDLQARLTALHLRYVDVEGGGLKAVYATIRRIGAAAEVSSRAERLVADIEARLIAIRAKSGARRPRVLLIVGRRPGLLADIVAVGRDSYLNDLLEIAGGTNALADEGLPEYPRISLETVVRLRPDVVIDTGDMGDTPEERVRRSGANRELWMRNALIANAGIKRIHATTTDALVVPGPRVVEAAEWLRALVHEGATP